jgi:hypothetical protein
LAERGQNAFRSPVPPWRKDLEKLENSYISAAARFPAVMRWPGIVVVSDIKLFGFVMF